MISAYLEGLGDSDKPVAAVLGKPFGIDELHCVSTNGTEWFRLERGRN